MKLFAHYWVSKRKGNILSISVDFPIPSSLDKQYRVSGKREARKIAKELNATCWNF